MSPNPSPDGTALADCHAGDPPFFLPRRSPSDEGASGAAHVARRPELASSDPSRLAALTPSHMDAFESNSEDFRSVIDDLTIENQLLRAKLKKYEKTHASHLQQDQLFEVRIHGLPAHKRRELEQTLRDFTSSLECTPEDCSLRSTHPQESVVLGRPSGPGPKLSSYSTSNSHPADSGYASMSLSGKALVAQPHHSGTLNVTKTAESHVSKTQNIKSYLKDIPEGLLPHHPPSMTDRLRKKLVVRRLEQLFTGKGPNTAQHSQSLQQQEVSQSAAKADRTAVEANGQLAGAEGHREAKILHWHIDVSLDSAPPALQAASDFEDQHSGESCWDSNATPDQRPTRPLDLDLNRAQVAADNMDYIRHLGVASPSWDATSVQGDEDGWVYLNLLIGMAQLHTMNVTPEFVRKGIAEMSHKFELSGDGRYIRWKGGVEGTQLSSDCESSEDADHGFTSHGYDYPSKLPRSRYSKPATALRSRSAHAESSAGSGVLSEKFPILLGPGSSTDPFHYKPLFLHRNGSDEEKDYLMNDTGSLVSPDTVDDGPNERSTSHRKDSGPIIFYNGAPFCTDLCGDVESAHYIPEYARASDDILGCTPTHSVVKMNCKVSERPLFLAGGETAKSWSDEDSIDCAALEGFEQPLMTDPEEVFVETAPMALEASGVGGVQPQDNFAIYVQVMYSLNHADEEPQSGGRLRSKTEIISTWTHPLGSAPLPPPSYVFLSLSSSSDITDDKDEDLLSDAGSRKSSSASPMQTDTFVLPKFRQTLSSQSTREISSDGGSDDSSIDMLAHARMIDPDSVAAREKEFDIAVDSSVSEGIPAASLAATIGDETFSSSSHESDDDEMASESAEAGSEGRPRRGSFVSKKRREVNDDLDRNVKRLRVY